MILLFFLLALPPIEEVSTHNDGIAASLVNTNAMDNGLRGSPSDPVPYAVAGIAGPYPMVDNRVSSINNFKTLWFMGYRYEKHVLEYYKHGCCIDTEQATSLGPPDIKINITFSFLNNSTTVESPPNPVLPPFSSSFLNLSRNDTVSIELNATMVFPYLQVFYIEEEVTVCDENGACHCSCIGYEIQKEVNITKRFHDRKEYIVEGGAPLPFQHIPPLLEQETAESSFASCIFTNRFFYNISAQNHSCLLYSFSINESPISFQSISSERSPSQCLESAEKRVPYPILQQNDSYILLYCINASYPSFGVHKATLSSTDHFGNSFYWEYTITTHNQSSCNGNFSRLAYCQQYEPKYQNICSSIALAIILGMPKIIRFIK
ncbi:MAG: hypothetical protein QW035_01890 [Candidatus Anstonellales archaeon]